MKPRSLSVLLFLLLGFSAAFCQVKEDKTKTEITDALRVWNETAHKSDLAGFMNLFDDTENIMLVGSDSGEIYKGKAEISKWLGGLFRNNSFIWEMKRVDIDSYKKTAWVFVDGAMVVTSRKGNQFTVPYRFSGVLVKRKDGWKWRIFNGSIPRGE